MKIANMDIKQASVDDKRWYALQVRSRHEKIVFQELERSGYTASLPLMLAIRQWSDRKKKVRVPLFRGYVFVQVRLNVDRFDVVKIPGVVRFVSLLAKPVPIPLAQMYWLDLVMQQENVSAHLEFPQGSKVIVAQGPMRGLQGTVIKKKAKTRLIVWFDVIMQGLAVEIDQGILKPQSVNVQIENRVGIYPQT